MLDIERLWSFVNRYALGCERRGVCNCVCWWYGMNKDESQDALF